MIGLDDIRRLVPHAGTMCLLECVVDYSDSHIVCTTQTQACVSNPLRSGGRLAGLAAVEYAAQTIALHGALTGRGRCSGALVAVRDLDVRTAWLHDILAPMTITTNLLAGDARGATASFDMRAEGRQLAGGRLTVVVVPPDSKPGLA